MKKTLIILLAIASLLFSTGAAYAADGVTHTVVRGNTLWLLGIQYGIPWQEIVRANSELLDPDLLYPGEKVWIPKAKPIEVSRGYGDRLPWSDIELMARVVMAESQGESYQGQVAVAAVLLNRLHDYRFPKTIQGIVYQPNAFEVVNIGSLWWGYPSQTAFNAVKEAINGYDPTGGALYFGTSASPFIWSKNIITQIGRHLFAR
jgi:N-acetylmuramoyl-L-alanine amidase